MIFGVQFWQNDHFDRIISDADELETDSTSDSSRETPPNGRKTFPKKQ